MYAVGVRPEPLRARPPGEGVINGEVAVVEELGSEAFVHVRANLNEESHLLVVRAPGETAIRRGDNVSIAFDGPSHVFTAEGVRLGD